MPKVRLEKRIDVDTDAEFVTGRINKLELIEEAKTLYDAVEFLRMLSDIHPGSKQLPEFIWKLNQLGMNMLALAECNIIRWEVPEPLPEENGSEYLGKVSGGGARSEDPTPSG
jgi:hypothetical protein